MDEQWVQIIYEVSSFKVVNFGFGLCIKREGKLIEEFDYGIDFKGFDNFGVDRFEGYMLWVWEDQ